MPVTGSNDSALAWAAPAMPVATRVESGYRRVPGPADMPETIAPWERVRGHGRNTSRTTRAAGPHRSPQGENCPGIQVHPIWRPVNVEATEQGTAPGRRRLPSGNRPESTGFTPCDTSTPPGSASVKLLDLQLLESGREPQRRDTRRRRFRRTARGADRAGVAASGWARTKGDVRSGGEAVPDDGRRTATAPLKPRRHELSGGSPRLWPTRVPGTVRRSLWTS